jgi:hypothetical protein
MDGEILVRKLDGKSVTVDPGPHTFKFEIAGAQAVVERALVKEGEKARSVNVSFDSGGTAASTEGGGTAAPEQDHGARPSPNGGGHTVYPWLVVGAGAATMVVGLVVLIASPGLPAGCDSTSKTCTRGATESASDFASRQEDAGRSEAQPTEGLIIGAIGLGVVGGGLLWHFLEPTGGERSGALHFTPWASHTSAGGSVGASF